MPELPEVETIRKDLEKWIVGKTIASVQILDGRVIRQDPQLFFRRMVRKTIEAVSRRGKAIMIKFRHGQFLIVQPMMTGQLMVYRKKRQPAPDKHTKIIFSFSDGDRMFYNDQRLFGRLFCVQDLSQVPFLKSLGPEPLEAEFRLSWLGENLRRHKMPIKSLLMNQHFIAGIGNIYACEILFRSGIAPLRPADSLKQKEVMVLHCMIPRVLKEAIKWRGTSMRTYLDTAGEKGQYWNRIKVYGREQERCGRCRSPIVKIVQSGRSTFYCQTCQG